MRIAVTGGAGFIGTHLIEALCREGHEIWACDNFSVGHAMESLRWGPQVTLLEGDLLHFDWLNRSLCGFQPELLFHLAAIHYIPYCNDHPAETVRVNVEGTVNVMRAAQQCADLKGVFFASSAAVYPATDAFHTETDSTGPSDIYGLSKVLGEQVVTHYAALSGISYVLGRFFNVFGPDETNSHLIPAVLRQVIDGRQVRMGRTDTYRDFIYVQDLVQALVKIAALLSLEKPVAEIYNLASGQEHSMLSVVEMIGHAAGVELEIISEQRHMRATDRKYLRADICKASNELGWAPQFSLERGLKEIIAAERAMARSAS